MELRIEYLPHYSIDAWGQLKYQHDGDAGFDLIAAISGPIRIPQAGLTKIWNPQSENNKGAYSYYFEEIKRVLIPTGIKVELPKGFELQVRSRSGLALKEGLFVLNSPGTVDMGYRGEVGVILCNLGSSEFIVEPGMRIAQAVISSIPEVKIIRVDKVSETSRGAGGFGSTGITTGEVK
jgi:dUTP pyrophosphatase